jgi:hypothetical protein
MSFSIQQLCKFVDDQVDGHPLSRAAVSVSPHDEDPTLVMIYVREGMTWTAKEFQLSQLQDQHEVLSFSDEELSLMRQKVSDIVKHKRRFDFMGYMDLMFLVWAERLISGFTKLGFEARQSTATYQTQKMQLFKCLLIRVMSDTPTTHQRFLEFMASND